MIIKNIKNTKYILYENNFKNIKITLMNQNFILIIIYKLYMYKRCNTEGDDSEG